MASAFAAKPIDLKHQSTSILASFVSTLAANQTSLKEVSRVKDFNQTTHVRLKQMYAGALVWGGDVVVHVPKGSDTTLMGMASNKYAKMNGFIYQDMSKDLEQAPSLTAEEILKHAVELFQKASIKSNSITDTNSSLMIFVDEKNKAHWAYLVSFLVSPANELPKKPTYIIDATTQHVYRQWDNIQTIEAFGGGFGGNSNPKMGKLTYDGLASNLPKLTIDRAMVRQACFLKNSNVTVKNVRKNDAVVQYSCRQTDSNHDNVWWNGDQDAVNGAFSPSNDALYAGHVIQDMYMNWYGIPALIDSSGKAMMLNMRVHADMENAYWDGEQMTFGDGGSTFYPLVSLGVGAHEVSHGFTEQHSALSYWSQSGGLNESFSDMAAQAAEFYSVGHNSWQIGPEIMKGTGALRYMDQPSKDCEGGAPGDWCSIDKTSQYYEGLDVHFSSGIFNRVFYLMGTAEGWNTRKAFDVMVQANQNYWTSNTTWTDAACGVLEATKDYGYDANVVKNAFNAVEVNFSHC